MCVHEGSRAEALTAGKRQTLLSNNTAQQDRKLAIAWSAQIAYSHDQSTTYSHNKRLLLGEVGKETYSNQHCAAQAASNTHHGAHFAMPVGLAYAHHVDSDRGFTGILNDALEAPVAREL